MKIGVWINDSFTPEEGGGFSYRDRLIAGINNFSFSDKIEVCFILKDGVEIAGSKKEIIYLPYKSHLNWIEKNVYRFFPRSRLKKYLSNHKTDKQNFAVKRCLRENNIDVLYYLLQMQYMVGEYPFIATNWDIGHRSTYAFPELAHDSFGHREHYYNNLLPRALMIFCESEAGKRELIKYTHINEDKIRVVPLFAGYVESITIPESKSQELLKNIGLSKNNYFFYPAQFWAHKNHYNLLKAFQSFCKDYPDYKLVFTGSDHGNKAYIEKCINSMNLSNNVMILGFVSDDIISTLYRNATALVMPTLMGPTNMPPLEAMALGCPVICSDMPGHREELGDAAIYIAPLKPETIDSAMREIHTNRSTYVEKIEQQREVSSFNIENALACINKHFVEIESIRNCWE